MSVLPDGVANEPRIARPFLMGKKSERSVGYVVSVLVRDYISYRTNWDALAIVSYTHLAYVYQRFTRVTAMLTDQVHSGRFSSRNGPATVFAGHSPRAATRTDRLLRALLL